MLTNFNSVYLSKYLMEIFVESCLNIVHSLKQIWMSHLCEATGDPEFSVEDFLAVARLAIMPTFGHVLKLIITILSRLQQCAGLLLFKGFCTCILNQKTNFQVAKSY